MPNNPQFPPINVLPVLLSAVSGALEASEEQLTNFRRAKNRPYSLDKKTINDVIRSYTKQSESIAHEKAMCAHWRSQRDLTTLQKRMLNELEDKLLRLEEVNLIIINLANTCKLKTIEQLIDQDDANLAITALQDWLSEEGGDEENTFDEDDDDDSDSFAEDEASEDDNLDIEEVECRDCGAIVARLIYDDEADSLEELEENAAHIISILEPTQVTTWIIADDEGDVMQEPWEEESLIKKVFPQPAPAKRISSERFDEELDALAENHCANVIEVENTEANEIEEGVEQNSSSNENTSSQNTEKMTQLNKIMMQALFELRALAELDASRPQELFDFVKTFLLGVISTSIDLVEIQQPGISTAMYAEIEAVAKMGGLRAIAEFQNKFSDRSYSVSQIADDDMETAMNYIGQELGSTLSKAVNELPMPLRQQETHLRGIEALLSNVLNQRFNNPHEILDALCEHVHMALDSLARGVH